MVKAIEADYGKNFEGYARDLGLQLRFAISPS
jgi:hypothetical protein